MTFVDIGAHIGYFTRLASKKVGTGGRVIAFEADPENFKLLEENTRHCTNTERVPEAIGAIGGRALFYHVRGSSGCHSLVPQSESDTYEVPVTTLDAYLEKKGLSVDMIKMDIEGGEWKALDGMEKTLRTPYLRMVLEYNPEALTNAGIPPHNILRRLISSDFSIRLITKEGLVPLAPSDLGIINRYLEAGSVNIYCVKA